MQFWNVAAADEVKDGADERREEEAPSVLVWGGGLWTFSEA